MYGSDYIYYIYIYISKSSIKVITRIYIKYSLRSYLQLLSRYQSTLYSHTWHIIPLKNYFPMFLLQAVGNTVLSYICCHTVGSKTFYINCILNIQKQYFTYWISFYCIIVYFISLYLFYFTVFYYTVLYGIVFYFTVLYLLYFILLRVRFLYSSLRWNKCLYGLCLLDRASSW